MSKKKRFGVSAALSRGLSETVNVVENNAGIFRNTIISLERIELDPENPRKLAITLEDVQKGLKKTDPEIERKHDELEKLKELAITIKNSGLINPIVVYKRGEKYRVVAGERRFLASHLAGKTEIDARIFNEKPNEFELKLLQWIENTAREDLTLDERIGNIRDIIHAYHQRHPGAEVTASALKHLVGLSLPQATYYLAVLHAPHDLKAVIESGAVRSLDKAAVIAGISSAALREEAINACINGCTLKELRKIVSSQKALKKKLKTQQVSAHKRGRVASRINMGFTGNPHVVKTIVRSVLSQTKFQKFSEHFAKIDWDHYEQATGAFKKLVEILEHESVR